MFQNGEERNVYSLEKFITHLLATNTEIKCFTMTLLVNRRRFVLENVLMILSDVLSNWLYTLECVVDQSRSNLGEKGSCTLQKCSRSVRGPVSRISLFSSLSETGIVLMKFGCH